MQGWEPPVHVGVWMSPLLVKTFVIWLYAGVLSGCLAIRTVFVTQYVTYWLKVEVKPNSVILILCTFHFVNHHISDRQIQGVTPPPPRFSFCMSANKKPMISFSCAPPPLHFQNPGSAGDSDQFSYTNAWQIHQITLSLLTQKTSIVWHLWEKRQESTPDRCPWKAGSFIGKWGEEWKVST